MSTGGRQDTALPAIRRLVYSSKRWLELRAGPHHIGPHHPLPLRPRPFISRRQRSATNWRRHGVTLDAPTASISCTPLHGRICPSNMLIIVARLVMYRLPTFVRSTLDQYTSKRGLADDYLRFGALQSVYATVIKYVGTTFALIAADHQPDLKDEAWGSIFDSTSLGGWMQAADAVCRISSKLPENVKSYCEIYSAYRRHQYRDTLDKITDYLNIIIAELTNRGYRIDSGKKP